MCRGKLKDTVLMLNACTVQYTAKQVDESESADSHSRLVTSGVRRLGTCEIQYLGKVHGGAQYGIIVRERQTFVAFRRTF